MKTAGGKLNVYALRLEDAQGDIRVIVKNAFFLAEPFSITEQKILKVINTAVEEISIDRLKKDAIQSLLNFANVQKSIWQSMSLSPLVIAYLGARAEKNFSVDKISTKKETAIKRQLSAFREYPTVDKGVPLQRFYNDVWNTKVKPTLDRLVNSVALDPNDLTGRNSLRNLAEMEVRYNDHLDNIAELKKKGTKIVVCSAHEDCSERCYPWQKQRFFSLDGTYGTIDGHKYIPLEVATDIWYTTKAGRRYKNGLLGFNCRHKLYAYNKQVLPPTVSKDTRAREYEITKKQRELERAVRKEKIKAEMLKGIDQKGYIKAKTKAKVLYEKYKNFSHSNDRAFYPMRTKI